MIALVPANVYCLPHQQVRTTKHNEDTKHCLLVSISAAGVFSGLSLKYHMAQWLCCPACAVFVSSTEQRVP